MHSLRRPRCKRSDALAAAASEASSSFFPCYQLLLDLDLIILPLLGVVRSNIHTLSKKASFQETAESPLALRHAIMLRLPFEEQHPPRPPNDDLSASPMGNLCKLGRLEEFPLTHTRAYNNLPLLLYHLQLHVYPHTQPM